MNAVPHQNTKYNWQKLANGKWHKLYFGKDFKCSVRSFRIQLYQAANRLGKTVKTRCAKGETFVAFQFCDK